LILWLELSGFAVAAVKHMPRDIRLIAQDFMDILHQELAALAGWNAFCVQQVCNGFHAHRAFVPFAVNIKFKNTPHDLGLNRIDLQFFLILLATFFCNIGAIAKRWLRAVPKSLCIKIP